jgi:hypothetical protein
MVSSLFQITVQDPGMNYIKDLDYRLDFDRHVIKWEQ